MKRSTKILGIILSALLLIGTVVGVTVFAESEPTVEFAGQNISYEGAVRVAYYVRSENVDEKHSIKLLVSDSPIKVPIQIKKTATDYEIVEPEATVTIDGVSYDVYYSYGVKTTELRRNIYATAVMVTTAGIVDAAFEAPVYSPYQYAMNRFDAEYTADQLDLYTALLDYAAAVQEVVFATEDGIDEEKLLLAGGWADAYYVVDETVVADGEVVSDKTEEYRSAEVGKRYMPEIPKWYGDNTALVLNGVTDSNGASFFGDGYAATYNSVVIYPGHTGYIANYETATGKYVTYEGGAEVTLGNKSTIKEYYDDYYTSVGANANSYINPERGFDSPYLTIVGADGYTYTYLGYGSTRIENGAVLVEKDLKIVKISDGTTEYTEIGTGFEKSLKVGDPIPKNFKNSKGETDKVSSEMVFACLGNTTPATETYTAVKMHVVEFDLTSVYTKNGGSGHIGQFWLSTDKPIVNSEGKTLYDENYVWGININANSDSSYRLSTYTATGYDTNFVLADGLVPGESYNIRVESYHDAYGEGTLLTRYYIDGVFVRQYLGHYSNTQNTLWNDDTAAFLRFAIPSNGTDSHFYLDNAYVATEYAEGDYLGLGKYTDAPATEDYDGKDATLVGTKYEESAFDALFASTSARGAGYTYRTEGENSYVQYAVKNGKDTSSVNVTPCFYSDVKYGETYVFATDFMWNGAALAPDDDLTNTDKEKAEPWYVRIGFRSIVGSATTTGDDTMLYIQGFSKQGAAAGDYVEGPSDDDLWLLPDSSSEKGTAFAVLERDEWYNIRIEYTPTSCTEVSGGKYKSTGTISVYINGAFAHSWSCTKSSSIVSNLSFDYCYIQGRQATKADGYGTKDYSYCLDNTYCSAISKSTEDLSYNTLNYDGRYASALGYDMSSIAASNSGFSFEGVGSAKFNTKADATNWARIATEGENKVLEVGTRASSKVITSFTSAGGVGDTYTFATSLKWMGSALLESYFNNRSVADSQWLFKLGLKSSAYAGTDDYLVPVFGCVNANDNIELRVGGNTEEFAVATLAAGTWYDLEIKYVPAVIDGVYSGLVMILVNGEAVYEGVYSGKPAIANTDYAGAYIELRGIARDAVLRLDNTFAGVVPSLTEE